MKKILSVMLTLCLCVNISFAFDPYADEEVEKKSYKKLYYGIVLTLLGGFLAYDGFSKEEVDVSKPKVDYLTVSHSEWVQIGTSSEDKPIFELRSGEARNIGISNYENYKIDDVVYTVEPNQLYNVSNVDLYNLKIEVRYKYTDGTYIGPNGEHVTKEYYYIDDKGKRVYVENQCYHTAQKDGHKYENIKLSKGKSVEWKDVWEYTSIMKDGPNSEPRQPYVAEGENPNPGTGGLNLGKDSPILMDVRVKLKKNQQYKPIYEKRNKCDAEGVAGILVGITGIYFIVDHFLDMHKFNAYAKKHHLNLKVATASNEYKLMLQKRI